MHTYLKKQQQNQTRTKQNSDYIAPQSMLRTIYHRHWVYLSKRLLHFYEYFSSSVSGTTYRHSFLRYNEPMEGTLWIKERKRPVYLLYKLHRAHLCCRCNKIHRQIKIQLWYYSTCAIKHVITSFCFATQQLLWRTSAVNRLTNK